MKLLDDSLSLKKNYTIPIKSFIHLKSALKVFWKKTDGRFTFETYKNKLIVTLKSTNTQCIHCTELVLILNEVHKSKKWEIYMSSPWNMNQKPIYIIRNYRILNAFSMDILFSFYFINVLKLCILLDSNKNKIIIIIF